MRSNMRYEENSQTKLIVRERKINRDASFSTTHVLRETVNARPSLATVTTEEQRR